MGLYEFFNVSRSYGILFYHFTLMLLLLFVAFFPSLFIYLFIYLFLLIHS